MKPVSGDTRRQSQTPSSPCIQFTISAKEQNLATVENKPFAASLNLPSCLLVLYCPGQPHLPTGRCFFGNAQPWLWEVKSLFQKTDKLPWLQAPHFVSEDSAWSQPLQLLMRNLSETFAFYVFPAPAGI